ncbi:MAG: cadherin-like beta sandwich domain-containing protein, partial [Salinivirgaceae bacterium]|nr:cadherin-like beta sandwich domain-containing protein [Salinivirgaceae bacterium]
MKQIYLLLRYSLVMMVFSLLGMSLVHSQATLKHSYTFEDGTANDGVGDADGILNGDATISDGAVTLTGNGFVSLPGKTIDVPSYSSISVESVFKQKAGLEDENVFTVLYGFGETNPDVSWMGIDYFIYQPTKKDAANSRFAISCDDTGSPWSTETGVDAKEIEDTIAHYVVTILTETEMKLYIDGALLGTAVLADKNKIVNLSNDTAYIGASVYPGDAKWKGAFYEMNIFEGELDEETIVQRAKELLGIDVANATLASIKPSKGILSPEFNPANDIYELNVEYGTTSVNIETTPTVNGAKVEMYDGLGNQITDGEVNFTGDGIDLEIIVTALNGSTVKSYYVSIFLDPEEETASLTGINLSKGYFTSEFDMDSLNYTAILPWGTTAVDVIGVPAWSGAVIEGGGTITLNNGTASTILKVTSENGVNIKEYHVDLYVSKFNSEDNFYIVHEASGFVIGESGETYNVIKLYHALNNSETQLFQFVPSGVDNQYFIKNQILHYVSHSSSSTWDMLMKESLTQNLDSCRFVVHEFEPGRFRIETVVKYGADQKYMGTNNSALGAWIFNDKYEDNTLAIWHILPPEEVVDPFDTYLANLSIDNGTLKPAFDPFINDYYVTLPIGTTTLTVTAEANDATSTVSGTGVANVSSGAGTITVTVTASIPQYTRQYNIHYQYNTPLTLKHAYTFADGTAQDNVGGAHGIVEGGSISNGVFISSQEGDYITLPAEDIAINAFPSITLEAYVMTGVNDGWTMLAYFGNSVGGEYSYWMSIAGQTDLTRAVLDQGQGASSADGVESNAGENHHYVSVLT